MRQPTTSRNSGRARTRRGLRPSRVLLVSALAVGLVLTVMPAAAQAATDPVAPAPAPAPAAAVASTAAQPQVQPVTSFPTDTDRWMGEYGDVIGQRLIKNVVFPGTHDSATNSLDPFPVRLQSGDQYTVLRTALIAAYGLGVVPGLILSGIVREWSVAQDQSILQQLNGGVREIDLRVCWDDVEQKIRICHGAFGSDVDPTLDDIATFVDDPAHSKEIVLVNVTPVDLDLDQEAALFHTIRSKLGDHLVDQSPDLGRLTVNDLWKRNQQVIVMSAGTCVDGCDYIWDTGALLDAPYNNVRIDEHGDTKHYTDDQLLDGSVIEERMSLALDNRDESKMLVMGTPITPDAAYTQQNGAECEADPLRVFSQQPCSLLEAAERSAGRMDDAMTWWATNQHSARKRINIISSDKYESTNEVPYAIRMNAGPVVAANLTVGGQPYDPDTWRGEGVQLNVQCASQPSLDLPFPASIPPASSGSTISNVTVDGHEVGQASGSFALSGSFPGPVDIVCTDEYGKEAHLSSPAIATLEGLSVHPASTSAAAGEPLAVTADGTFAAPASGVPRLITDLVTFTVTGPSGIAAPCTGNVCHPTEAGTNTITGTPSSVLGGPQSLSASTTVQISAGQYVGITLSPSTATITAGASQQYAVDLVDAYGNVVGDVTARSTVALGSLGPCPSDSCTTTTAGTYDVVAAFSTTSTTLVAHASLTVTPGPFAGIALSPSNATISAGSSQQYSVDLVDSYGNPISDVTASAIVALGPFGQCLTTGCTTNTAGTYDVVGLHFGTGFPITAHATLTVTPAMPAKLTAEAGSVQSALSGSTFTNPLVASVADSYGNPVPDTSVLFTVTSGAATFAGGATTASVTTNEQGVATSPTLTAGSSPGPVAVTASSVSTPAAEVAEFLETVVSPAAARADLSVSLQAPSALRPGAHATVELTVTNHGPNPAGPFLAGLLLPPGFTATDTGGGSKRGSAILFSGPGLDADASATYTVAIAADAKASGTELFRAAALSATRDPSPTNNLVVTTVNVAPK